MKPKIAADNVQPKEFTFDVVNLAKAKKIIAAYPDTRGASAVLPLLDLAQRQQGGWLPRAAMVYIADMLDMPAIKVFEVASFYSMFNLSPVGENFVQICRTTPCWLRGSDRILKVCTDHLKVAKGETTKDGLFTVVEVECLGACVDAPVVQINDDYHENLTEKEIVTLLDRLRDGKKSSLKAVKGKGKKQ